MSMVTLETEALAIGNEPPASSLADVGVTNHMMPTECTHAVHLGFRCRLDRDPNAASTGPDDPL